MSSTPELMNWLRDAHAMEMQAIQIQENQAWRIESYPELRNRILEHLEETEAQPKMLERCIERHATTSSAETARVCREILQQEEAMAGWLERHLPEITRQYLRRELNGEQAKR